MWLLADQIRAFCQALAQIGASPSLADCLSPLLWVGEKLLCTTAVITVVLLGEGRFLPVPLVTLSLILVLVSPGFLCFPERGCRFGEGILPAWLCLWGCEQLFPRLLSFTLDLNLARGWLYMLVKQGIKSHRNAACLMSSLLQSYA